MTSGFPKHIEQALDSYRLPQLSDGFADRLVKKAVAEPAPAAKMGSALPWRRDRKPITNSPWKRGGYVASGVVGFGLVSAAAAAALSIAEVPVRIPVLTDLVEQVLPQPPAKAATPDVVAAEKKAVSVKAGLAEGSEAKVLPIQQAWREMSRAEKRAVLVDRVKQNEERVQERRAKRGLPPLTETQLRRRRVAIRRAIARGDISRPAVRRAVRRAAREQRLANRQKNSQPATNLSPSSEKSLPIVAPKTQPRPQPDTAVSDSSARIASSDQEDKAQTNALTDPVVASTGDAAVAAEPSKQLSVEAPATPLTTEQKLLLQERLPARVKNRLKNASPAERRRILRDLRKRRASQKNLRDARKKMRDIRNRSK